MGSNETATATTGGPRVITYLTGTGCHRVQIAHFFRMLDALIVVLPDGLQSLCDMDKDIAQEVDQALYQYWNDGYGKDENLPVLVMKNTKADGKFMKETFVQAFSFESGNCIYTNGDGYGNHYYGVGC